MGTDPPPVTSTNLYCLNLSFLLKRFQSKSMEMAIPHQKPKLEAHSTRQKTILE